jgi:plastocyanin
MNVKVFEKEISTYNFKNTWIYNNNNVVFAQNNTSNINESKSIDENMSVKSNNLYNNVTEIQVPKSMDSSAVNLSNSIKDNDSDKIRAENHSSASLPSSKTVIIVKGAALLRDKAFYPNPIIIHAEDSINWINKDDVVHTITSGASFNSPNRCQEFDSGMLGGSYTHKFMKAGIYNYFCQIHPTMVGKIIVEKNG